MDIKKLEIFCKVVAHGSFTQAAKELGISQPAVSDQIKLLEQGLNQQLLIRSGRSVLPTEVGKLLEEYAIQILHLKREAFQKISNYSQLEEGSLQFGASSIPGNYLLPLLLGPFRQLYPKVRLSIKIENSGTIAQRILAGELEFGVVGGRWIDPQLEWLQILMDPLVVITPPKHGWSEMATIPMKAFQQEPLLVREGKSGTRSFLEQTLSNLDIAWESLNIVCELGATEAIRRGVKSGAGIAVISRHAVSDDLEAGSLNEHSLQGVKLERPLFMLQRRGTTLTPLCNLFLDFIKEKFAALLSGGGIG